MRILKEGVQLKGEKKPFIARELEKVSDTVVKISIAEGVYHQVRRMFAAVSNHVEDLERISLGNVKLDPALELGKWRFLSAEEIAEFQ
jgi:16S rRNA pseudouridine516 synthase